MQKVGLPARAYASGPVYGTSGALFIGVDTIDFDPGGVVDTAHYFGGSNSQLQTNSYVYICPVQGLYLVHAQIKIAANAAGDGLQVMIGQNSPQPFVTGTLVRTGGQTFAQAAANAIAVTIATIIQCAQGDTLELWGQIPSFATAAGSVGLNNYMEVQQVA
jgi:hypothetical protein